MVAGMFTATHPRHPRRRDPIFFRPATVALSRGARATLELADASLRVLLARHTRGDWGIFHDDDVRENDWALTHAAPVRSLFALPTGAELLLETNGPRTLTCVTLARFEDPYVAAQPSTLRPLCFARNHTAPVLEQECR